MLSKDEMANCSMTVMEGMLARFAPNQLRNLNRFGYVVQELFEQLVSEANSEISRFEPIPGLAAIAVGEEGQFLAVIATTVGLVSGHILRSGVFPARAELMHIVSQECRRNGLSGDCYEEMSDLFGRWVAGQKVNTPLAEHRGWASINYICWQNKDGWRVGQRVDARAKSEIDKNDFAILVDTSLTPPIRYFGKATNAHVGLADVNLAWLSAFIICVCRSEGKTTSKQIHDSFIAVTGQKSSVRYVASELARARNLVGDRTLIASLGRRTWHLPDRKEVCLIVGPESPFYKNFAALLG